MTNNVNGIWSGHERATNLDPLFVNTQLCVRGLWANPEILRSEGQILNHAHSDCHPVRYTALVEKQYGKQHWWIIYTIPLSQTESACGSEPCPNKYFANLKADPSPPNWKRFKTSELSQMSLTINIGSSGWLYAGASKCLTKEEYLELWRTKMTRHKRARRTGTRKSPDLRRIFLIKLWYAYMSDGGKPCR